MGWCFELGSEGIFFFLHVVLSELIHLSGAFGTDRPVTSYRVSHSQESQARSQDDSISREACSMWHFLKSMLKLVQFYFCHVLIVKAKHKVSQYSRDRGTDFLSWWEEGWSYPAKRHVCRNEKNLWPFVSPSSSVLCPQIIHILILC